jgi:cob(II)yrinic acid a,c-diamide reductase
MKSDNDCFAENGVFALNTLSAGQVEIANAFSGLTGLSQEDRFALGSWSTLSTGSPALDGAQAVFDCRVVEARDMASHRVLFGKVTGLRIGDSVDPLIYHHRQYRTL